jgi:hypothetical protein
MSPQAAGRTLEVRRVVSAAGDLLVVEVAEPVPIGTRVAIPSARVGFSEPGEGSLRGKIIDVRRADGAYSMTIRLHSVTRAQREAIALVVGDPQGRS